MTKANDLTLSRLIAFDYPALRTQRTIGPVKLRCILEIIEAVAQNPVKISALLTQPSHDAREVLKEWGVPESHSVARIPFSIRLHKVCDKAMIRTLGDLLNTLEQCGEEGLLHYKKLGRRSMREILDMHAAISTRNRQEARRWLPLAEGDSKGLSFQAAVRQLTAAFNADARKRIVLDARFVAGLSMQQAGDAAGFSHDRASQIEKNFIQRLSRLLDEYPEDKKNFLALRSSGVASAMALGLDAASPDFALLDGVVKRMELDELKNRRKDLERRIALSSAGTPSPSEVR